MTPPLFLLDPLPSGDTVELAGDEGHHAARVRRVRPGEDVLIGDGRGATLACVVNYVDGAVVTLRVHDRRQVAAPDPRLVVVQALPKGERAELAVEVLTELGVDEILPWAASRSVVQWHGERGSKALGRWRRTATEAAKQSRRAWVPAVGDVASTAGVAARLSAAVLGLVLQEDAATALSAVPLPDGGDVVIVVGPEGGVSPEELAAFSVATQVRLGAPVLRTSTAGAAALAALSVRLGRWN